MSALDKNGYGAFSSKPHLIRCNFNVARLDVCLESIIIARRRPDADEARVGSYGVRSRAKPKALTVCCQEGGVFKNHLLP